jgi:hypothetical protein
MRGSRTRWTGDTLHQCDPSDTAHKRDAAYCVRLFSDNSRSAVVVRASGCSSNGDARAQRRAFAGEKEATYHSQ